jgi:stress response protein YsnF
MGWSSWVHGRRPGATSGGPVDARGGQDLANEAQAGSAAPPACGRLERVTMHPDEVSRRERMPLPIHEAVLAPTITEALTGRVRVHTRVALVPGELTGEAGHDEVTSERSPLGRPVDSVPAPWQDGDTLVVPMVDDVIVTETRLLLREEVRITRRRVTAAVTIPETVRREMAEITPDDTE